ncbi:CLUMA_CG009783, isoform A [Clunio marinus]|uniref:CLUMA_CG009783, isoform A n=1 Tax=Clunio marinus TaxID=568069 RepID=A0A1J1IBK8_9DIPT|nr:CLUMA_CG009783, isoform A [Clunio marinus]
MKKWKNYSLRGRKTLKQTSFKLNFFKQQTFPLEQTTQHKRESKVKKKSNQSFMLPEGVQIKRLKLRMRLSVFSVKTS